MRKLFLFLAIIALTCLSACSNVEEENPTNGESTITFRIANFEQTSLDSVSTRATSVDTLAHLAMGIYDASTYALVNDVQIQDKASSNYGTFSISLPYGNYIIVFLGYDGSRSPQMENPKAIAFADDYVPNLFCKSMEMTVDASTTKAQSVTIKRAVACFSLVCNGDIPDNLAKMKFTMQGGSGTLNALTGFADNSTERTYTYKNLSSYAGTSSMTINVYTFLTADESEMNFTVTALDADDNTILSREYSNVPMKINQRSRYTGSFFSQETTSQALSIMLEDAVWSEKDFEY